MTDTTSKRAPERSFSLALEQALAIVRRTIPKMGLDRPKIGRPDFTYERCGPDDWVDGFWSGQLWLAFALTGDDIFRDAAEAYRPYFRWRLDRRQGYSHDFGFLYSLSMVAEHQLTGAEEAKEIALRAAEILAARYNPMGRFIQAWDETDELTNWHSSNRGKMIVDCMENLCLLYWAAAAAGRSEFADLASAHAETTRRHMVRPDFSTFHIFRFDPDSGAVIGGGTFQGHADDSCWSRGQSWAIHGFTQAYRHTHYKEFLDTAMGLADYAITRLPADGVPLWDYCLDAGAPAYRDTSAAAIMAAGLYDLADHVERSELSDRYRTVANHILCSLTDDYSLLDHPTAEGLLRRGAEFVRMGLCDTMLPFGDYFYVEALARRNGLQQLFW